MGEEPRRNSLQSTSSSWSRSVDGKVIENEVASEQRRVNARASLLYQKIKAKIKSTLTLKTIANAVFVLTVSFICITQCHSQITEYFEYDTRVAVSHSFPKSNLGLIPGITICNNNRVRMEKLTQETVELEAKLQSLLLSRNITAYQKGKESENRMELMKAIKDVVDESVDITSLLNDSPIPKLLYLSRTKLIKDINCNSLWDKPFNCENFKIIESFQSVPCYTVFYQGSTLEALTSGRAYDFKTSLLEGKRKLDSFASNEIVEVLVDFEQFEHADFQHDVGGKFVIHSTRQVGTVRDMAHSILPGQSYDIIIRRQLSKRLPPPYKSMCYDYKLENSGEFTNKRGAFPSVELDKGTCVRNCIVKQTTEHCNCWPVEVPFYLGDNLVNNSDSYRMCPWGTEDLQSKETTELHVRCFKKFQGECIQKCRPDCTTSSYQVQVMSKPWPTRELPFSAISEKDKIEMRRLRGCCAKISIKYHEFIETRHVMYPSMTLAQLVSNIGGIVSALVGISVIAAYRFFTRKVLHCKIYNDKPLV